MKKFIIAAPLILLGGVASVKAQSGAGQEEISVATIIGDNKQIIAVETVSTVESEELRKKLEDKVSNHLEARIQEKLDSQFTFAFAN